MPKTSSYPESEPDLKLLVVLEVFHNNNNSQLMYSPMLCTGLRL